MDREVFKETPQFASTVQGVSQERSRNVSSQLSPRAKREILLSPADKVVSVLVNVSSSVDRARFTRSVQNLGGNVVTWADVTNLVTLTIPAGKLDTLAGIDGVIYVETGGHYGN